MKNETVIIAEPGKQGLIITREFEAPRELVFQTFTDASILTQWLPPEGAAMELKVFEPRTGGHWHYVLTTPGGLTFGAFGVFHDITAPERVIQTFEFDGMAQKGHVSLETARFEALPHRRTKLTINCVFLSVADRDAKLQAGLCTGVVQAHARLDKLLQSATLI